MPWLQMFLTVGRDYFLIISKTAFRQIIPMAPMPHCATTSIATATVSGTLISYKQQYAVVTVTANTALNNSTVCLVNQVSDILTLAYTRQRHKLVWIACLNQKLLTRQITWQTDASLFSVCQR
jgi:hypothetical protein